MIGKNKESSVLVLSLANHGYQHLYADNLDSHKIYANMQGYDYLCMDRKVDISLGIEVVWLKLYAMREALQKGYGWVMFVDADAFIRAEAPEVESLDTDGKTLYMCLGYSGRINSGVIIAKKSFSAIKFFSDVIAAMDVPLGSDDDVGWGENGHVILVSHNNPSVLVVDNRWNNNHIVELDDYVRHYSAGPMRALFRTSVYRRVMFVIIQVWFRLLKRLSSEGVGGSIRNSLDKAHRNNCLSYRELGQGPVQR